MKAKLPHSVSHQLTLLMNHRYEVDRFNQLSKSGVTESLKQKQERIHQLHDSIMEYDEVEKYNLYGSNYCKFGNDETFDICEGAFRQTLRHYTVHGNCCQTCSNYFTQAIRLKTGQSV